MAFLESKGDVEDEEPRGCEVLSRKERAGAGPGGGNVSLVSPRSVGLQQCRETSICPTQSWDAAGRGRREEAWVAAAEIAARSPDVRLTE